MSDERGEAARGRMAAGRRARLVGDAGVFEDGAARDELLGGVPGDGDHGEAAVVELLEAVSEAHRLRPAAVQAERVEAEVARLVLAGVHAAAPLQGEQLDGGGEEDADGEEGGRDLLEAAVEQRRHALGGRAGGVRHEEVGPAERAGEEWLEELGDGPAEGGEHGEAAVLDLCGQGAA